MLLIAQDRVLSSHSITAAGLLAAIGASIGIGVIAIVADFSHFKFAVATGSLCLTDNDLFTWTGGQKRQAISESQ